jgi:hypothetical protein
MSAFGWLLPRSLAQSSVPACGRAARSTQHRTLGVGIKKTEKLRNHIKNLNRNKPKEPKQKNQFLIQF